MMDGKKRSLIEEQLDLIHEHLNGNAMVRITWIIIWLIVVAILVELVSRLHRARFPHGSSRFTSRSHQQSSAKSV